MISILHNNIVPVIVFSIKQHEIKQEARRSIKENDFSSEDIVVIKVASDLENNLLKWVEEDEFLFKDVLYDLVDKREINDSIYLYAKADFDEVELLKEIKSFINDHLAVDLIHHKNTRVKINFKQIFKKGFFFEDFYFNTKFLVSSFRVPLFYYEETIYCGCYLESSVPPPEC